MKITKRQLSEIIAKQTALAEATVMKGTQEVFGGDLEADFIEEAIAAEISTLFQEYVQEQNFEGTGATWNTEVQNAAQALYELIINDAALVKVLDIIEAVDQDLHDGQFV
tara:strand:- start:721 stop:1050 length:330 start_codon:yes stop_codon:yes gene_type:complete